MVPGELGRPFHFEGRREPTKRIREQPPRNDVLHIVGGAITGNGADVIIIDDPQNPLMANSETERQNSIDFFKNTLQTRLNDPKTGAFIIIMQRLHENDLTGYILSEQLGYTHLCLPAEAPERTIITLPKSGQQTSGKKVIY